MDSDSKFKSNLILFEEVKFCFVKICCFFVQTLEKFNFYIWKLRRLQHFDSREICSEIEGNAVSLVCIEVIT